MEDGNAIRALRSKQYGIPANIILEKLLASSIHKLKTHDRDALTKRVSAMVKANHERINSVEKGNYSSTDIAEMAYEETYGEVEELLKTMGFKTSTETMWL